MHANVGVKMYAVGDLVFEIMAEPEWFEKNPWMVGTEIGVILSINDDETCDVYWSDETVTQMPKNMIGRMNA